VYVDDGVSGAEFANRPGFLRLMNALKPRPTFQVLVMSEESRLGREAIETAYALKQLVTAGVRVFFYLEDRERTLDSRGHSWRARMPAGSVRSCERSWPIGARYYARTCPKRARCCAS
jgi:DNA invertase Pin-like site-specific DNA recombinase